MPSRMPNWKMRANALVDGMPMTRLCRMPSCGLACMMRTRRSTASAVIRLSASSTSAKSCCSPQRSQKSRMLPALKPVLMLAAAVGERDAAAPGIGELREHAGSRWRRARGRWCRSAHRDGSCCATPRAIRPSIIGAMWRMTRSGGSLRMQTRIAVDATIGSRPVTRAGRRRHRRHRIAREAHDDEADGGVPEADHRSTAASRRTAGPAAGRRGRSRPPTARRRAARSAPAIDKPTSVKNKSAAAGRRRIG